ncbi:MAG: aldo/keto reductase [Opitutales bacterium]
MELVPRPRIDPALFGRIGLGTWGLGGVYYGEVSDSQGEATVRAYLDGGGRHIDTAYSYHKSELVIGQAIRDYPRESFFLSSKTYAGSFGLGDLPKIREHVEISLRDLGTDYLDCYLIHGTPRDPEHLDRLIDAFAELREAGKIRSIGASIKGPGIDDTSLDTAMAAAQNGGLDLIQLSFSVARQKHAAAIETARRNGVVVIARWILESGMLTGKYPPGTEFAWPDTRNRYQASERDGILQIGQDLKALLPEGYSTPRELAVGFALAQPGVSGIILGANSPEHARSNLALEQLLPLPRELVTEIQRRYGPLNDAFNPTGAFEHVDSLREPLVEPRS